MWYTIYRKEIYMKKIICGFIFTICAVMLTGCGSSEKKLNCSIDGSKLTYLPSGVSLVQDTEVKFKNDKIETVEMIYKVDIDSSLSSSAIAMYNSLKSTYENMYGKYDGVKVTTNKTSDLKFDIVVSIDFKNISNSTKTALKMNGSESYSVNKNQLENMGYTCK